MYRYTIILVSVLLFSCNNHKTNTHTSIDYKDDEVCAKKIEDEKKLIQTYIDSDEGSNYLQYTRFKFCLEQRLYTIEQTINKYLESNTTNSVADLDIFLCDYKSLQQTLSELEEPPCTQYKNYIIQACRVEQIYHYNEKSLYYRYSPYYSDIEFCECKYRRLDLYDVICQYKGYINDSFKGIEINSKYKWQSTLGRKIDEQ